jgi:hypothetical protein
MVEAIVAMTEETPFTGASIVEEALQTASGTRIPIKCFGCSGLTNYNDKSYHLWQDCPNKGDQAKLTLKARGPYRVLEEAGENFYFIQKLPAVQSLTKRPGKRMKELVMRMERLPSSMVVHKRVATLDTRLAEMEGELVSNPLERNLGFYDFGRYTKAADDTGFAFEKMNDIWNKELETELNSED